MEKKVEVVGFVMLLNGGLYKGGMLFKSREDVYKKIVELCDGSKMVDEDGEEIELDSLDEMDRVVCFEDGNGMCEYGDDYVNLGICEIYREVV